MQLASVRCFQPRFFVFFSQPVVIRLQAFLLILLYAFFGFLFLTVNSSSGQHTTVWNDAEHYACSCFSLARTYEVRPDFVATLDKVAFGVSTVVIPLFSGSAELSEWLRKTNLHHVVYDKEGRDGTLGKPLIHEFALTAVVTAGPLMSYDMRERLLDFLSRGKYFQLKVALDRAVAIEERETIKRQIRDLRKQHGFVYDASPQNDVPNFMRQLVVTRDGRHYKTVEEKQKAWAQHCHQICNTVNNQDTARVKLEPHLENAVLKLLSDPLDVGSIVSPEPLHMALTDMIIPLDWDDPLTAEKFKRWLTSFAWHYRSGLNALRNDRTPFSVERPTTERLKSNFLNFHGEKTTWRTLLRKYGIMRQLSEVEFPYCTRDYVRSVHTSDTPYPPERGHPIVRATEAGRLTVTPMIPRVVEAASSPELEAEGALNRFLTVQPSPLAFWPQGVPTILSRRVTAIYDFTARLEYVPGKGLTVSSLYTGFPSQAYRHKVEFIHVYLKKTESKILEAKMTELILKVWGKHIAHEYKHERPKYQLLPEIEKRIPIKIHTQDSRNKYRRDCSSRQNSNCGHTSTRTTTRTRRDSEASSSWSSSSDGAASCSESEYSSQSSDANTFSPKHQLRFFPDSTDQEIRAITIKYFGAFYLSCWHSHNGGNINKANNGLAFIVRPHLARIRRRDGMAKDYQFDTPSAVVELFAHSPNALTRLASASGVHSSFANELRSTSSNAYALIYENIFADLKANKDRVFFEKNTCSIDKQHQLTIQFPTNLGVIPFFGSNGQSGQLGEFGKNFNQLDTLLAKCYGRVLPGTVLSYERPQGGRGQKRCEEIPKEQRYALVERNVPP